MAAGACHMLITIPLVVWLRAEKQATRDKVPLKTLIEQAVVNAFPPIKRRPYKTREECS